MLYRRREIQEDIVILGLDPRLLSEPNIILQMEMLLQVRQFLHRHLNA